MISNAINYGSNGKKIVLDCDDLGESWRIKVMDFGEGIKDEFKDGIFERFTRRDKSGVRGSGLGLAIVKRIVDLHNGKVWVEDNTIEYSDEQGRTQRKVQGAVFVVELPKGLE